MPGGVTFGYVVLCCTQFLGKKLNASPYNTLTNAGRQRNFIYTKILRQLRTAFLRTNFPSCFGAAVTNLSEPLRVFCSLPIIAG